MFTECNAVSNKDLGLLRFYSTETPSMVVCERVDNSFDSNYSLSICVAGQMAHASRHGVAALMQVFKQARSERKTWNDKDQLPRERKTTAFPFNKDSHQPNEGRSLYKNPLRRSASRA